MEPSRPSYLCAALLFASVSCGDLSKEGHDSAASTTATAGATSSSAGARSAAPKAGAEPADAHDEKVLSLLRGKEQAFSGTIDQEDVKIPFTFKATDGLVDATTPEATANAYVVSKDENETRGPEIIIGISPNETMEERAANLTNLGYEILKKEAFDGGWIVSAAHDTEHSLDVTSHLALEPKAIGCTALARGPFNHANKDVLIGWMEKVCRSLKAK